MAKVLVLSDDAAEAELDAMDENRLDEDYNVEKDAFGRHLEAAEALKLEALALAEAYRTAA